jgi:poly-D-alanine transfer protein DltD
MMFNYVETMKKAAFQIMSKTFVTKRKDTGQGYYDHYPLNDLVHLSKNQETQRRAIFSH